MLKDLYRYLSSGRPVEIIYMDRSGRITQRRIKLHSVNEDQVKAYCFTRGLIRSFAISNILAIVAAELQRGA